MTFPLYEHRRRAPFALEVDREQSAREKAADALYDFDDEYRELGVALHQIQNAQNAGAVTLADVVALMERRREDLVDEWLREAGSDPD